MGLKALPKQQSATPKRSHDPKPLPRSCRPGYWSLKAWAAQLSRCGRGQRLVAGRSQADAQLEDQRHKTPSTPEPRTTAEMTHDQADFPRWSRRLDDDSGSDYINSTSDDEEDYDDGECI
ncbi:amyloid beta A4 precursor protein-binding family A member 2-like isoform X1, partial [Lates japonicus]